MLISLDHTVFEYSPYIFSQTADDYSRPHLRRTLVLQGYNMFIKKLSQKYDKSETVCTFYINFHAIYWPFLLSLTQKSIIQNL